MTAIWTQHSVFDDRFEKIMKCSMTLVKKKWWTMSRSHNDKKLTLTDPTSCSWYFNVTYVRRIRHVDLNYDTRSRWEFKIHFFDDNYHKYVYTYLHITNFKSTFYSFSNILSWRRDTNSIIIDEIIVILVYRVFHVFHIHQDMWYEIFNNDDTTNWSLFKIIFPFSYFDMSSRTIISFVCLKEHRAQLLLTCHSYLSSSSNIEKTCL